MSWILGYGCTTAAGSGSETLFASLLAGSDHRTWLDPSQWPGQDLVKAPAKFKAFLWKTSAAQASEAPGTQLLKTPRLQPLETPSLQLEGTPRLQRERLLQEILISWEEALRPLDETTRTRLMKAASGAGSATGEVSGIGVILASTKSFVDDFIWNPRATSDDSSLHQDALRPLLDDFLKATELKPLRSTAVSNACASSLSALALAEIWLREGDVSDVIIIAADSVGPFVVRGFETLRVLTSDHIRSFSATRSGFHLGEASAAIILSKHRPTTSVAERALSLRGVGIDAEGFAVTRPSQSGESLKRACLEIGELLESPPDLIVAHGTGTKVNDQIEDHVYHEIFSSGERAPLVTGAKWCVGHTLGACGAIDVIAALEVLKKQKAFHLAKTDAASKDFKCRYLTAGSHSAASGKFDRVMVSSLGFGGIHASALVEWKS